MLDEEEDDEWGCEELLYSMFRRSSLDDTIFFKAKSSAKRNKLKISRDSLRLRERG